MPEPMLVVSSAGSGTSQATGRPLRVDPDLFAACNAIGQPGQMGLRLVGTNRFLEKPPDVRLVEFDWSISAVPA
jgi:hypothetical protein